MSVNGIAEVRDMAMLLELGVITKLELRAWLAIREPAFSQATGHLAVTASERNDS